MNYGVYLSLKNFDLNIIHSADPVGNTAYRTSMFVSNVVGTGKHLAFRSSWNFSFVNCLLHIKKFEK